MLSIAQTTNSETLTTDVPCNEYPNAPWNTVQYRMDAEYPSCSPEWFAQQSAKHALKYGMKYGTRDHVAEQLANLDAYLVARGDRRSHSVVDQPQAIEPVKSTEYPQVAPLAEEPVQGLANAKNGIITDSHLYRYVGGKVMKTPLKRAVEVVTDIHEIALEYNLRTIWVLAGTDLSHKATSSFIVASSPWLFKGNPQMTKGHKKHIPHCKFVAAYQEDQRTVYAGFLEYNTDWKLDKTFDPVVALATLTYIEDALGVAAVYSAGKTGIYLMKKVNQKKRVEWIEKIDIRKITPLREQQACVGDLNWKRELTQDDTGYLVSFDKNMAYPASCTSVLLGSGSPTHESNPTFDLKKSKPGLWCCKISGTSQFDGVHLPHPTDGKTEGWFYTYTVKLLHEVGYQVEITEAWVWNECHTILRPYAEKLFEAREKVDDGLSPDTQRYKNAEARKIASKAIKFIAVKSLGWTRQIEGRMDTDEELDWYIRPDWDDLIIDNARYQIFWRIRTCMKSGYYPVGVHADCLYFTSPVSDHEQALPNLEKPMMDRRKKLGGYKQHYQTPITIDEARDIFTRNKTMSTANTELLSLDTQHVKGE